MSNFATILSLARAGATARAWDSFLSEGLGDVTNNPTALTLKGRLLKDQARKAKGEAAAWLYLQSAEAYADAAALGPDSYPLINAATMSLFAGQPPHMALLAQRVLEMLDTGSGAGETPYWHEATRAEALLLLGRRDDARAALDKAIFAAPAAWEDRAATLRQFREIAEFRGEACAWLARYAPPASLYFKGMIGISPDDLHAAKIARDATASANAGFGYGALAAGSDILIAEALIEQGAELHVVLPLIPSAFRAQSVAPFGDAWLPRYDRLFELAASVTIVATDEALTHAAVQFAAQAAKGAALENAAKLEGKAGGLELNDIASQHFVAATDNLVPLERSATLPGAALDDGKLLISLIVDHPDLDTQLWGAVAGGFYMLSVNSFVAADTLLANVRQAMPDARCAVAAIAGAITTGDSDSHVAKVVRMAQCAAAGTTVTDKASALAMRSIFSTMRFEPLGELPDKTGAIDIYAILSGR